MVMKKKNEIVNNNPGYVVEIFEEKMGGDAANLLI